MALGERYFIEAIRAIALALEALAKVPEPYRKMVMDSLIETLNKMREKDV